MSYGKLKNSPPALAMSMIMSTRPKVNALDCKKPLVFIAMFI